jgi:hypothetical protein
MLRETTQQMKASAEPPIAADSRPMAITANFGVAASTEARPLDPQEMLQQADVSCERAGAKPFRALAAPQQLTTTSPVPAHAAVPRIVPR